MESSPFPVHVLYTTHIEKADFVRMEASPFPVHVLCTTHIEKADSLSEWRPLPFLYTFYIQLIYRRSTLWQNGGLSLSCTLSVYKSYKEGWVCVMMGASSFSIQLLYTTHIQKADSLSEWRLLSLPYSCYIQPI